MQVSLISWLSTFSILKEEIMASRNKNVDVEERTLSVVEAPGT